MRNMLNFKKGKNFHKWLYEHPEECNYKIGDKVQFLNRKGIWIDSEIIGFNIKTNRFQAILKCNNKKCKTHKICIYSIFLRRKI